MPIVSWVEAGVAVIKLMSAIVSWMERQAGEKAGFNKAIALEMEAAARARAKIAGIADVTKRLSDEDLAAKLARYRRPPKSV